MLEKPFSAYRGNDEYVFVSYAHADAEVVYPELEWLNAQGFNVWYDEGISPGSSWRQEIAQAIGEASLVLFFVSPRSVASANCQREVDFAIDEGLPLAVVHLEATTLPDGMRLSLGPIQAIHRFELTERDYRRRLIESVLRQRSTLDSRSVVGSKSRGTFALGVAVVGALGVGALATWVGLREETVGEVDVERYRVPLPEGFELPIATLEGYGNPIAMGAAISGDGRWVVSHAERGGQAFRWRRGDLQTSPLMVSESSAGLSLSFDGEVLVQGSREGLHRYTRATGLGATSIQAGVGDPDIDDEGNTVLDEYGVGVVFLPANGGQRELLVAEDDQHLVRYPRFLPGGQGILFSKLDRVTRDATLALFDFETRQTRELIAGVAAGASGAFVMFYRDDKTWAVRYDPATLELTSEPVAVLDRAAIDVSASGDMVYLGLAASTERTAEIIDRAGSRTSLDLPPGLYVHPRVSPSGDEVAYAFEYDLWVYTLSNARLRRLTNTDAHKGFPAWSPDERTLVFTGVGRDNMNIFRVPADRISTAVEIFDLPGSQAVAGFLADGRLLYRGTPRGATSFQPAAHVLDLSSGQTEMLIDGAIDPEIHPSGRWIAYTAVIDGRGDIYVGSFPDVNRSVVQVSTGGASIPVWSNDGDELFYLDRSRTPQGIVSVSIREQGDDIEIGEPEYLFPLHVPIGGAPCLRPATRWSVFRVPAGRCATGTRLRTQLDRGTRTPDSGIGVRVSVLR